MQSDLEALTIGSLLGRETTRANGAYDANEPALDAPFGRGSPVARGPTVAGDADSHAGVIA